MSTNDVPGFNPANGDKLAMGCWAEHPDGSYILVEGVENGRVIYEIFDTTKTPVMAYRDAMPEDQFKKQFSYDPNATNSTRWVWHDKQVFQWEVLFQKGLQPGNRAAFAADAIAGVADLVDTIGRVGSDDDTAPVAQRVASDLGLRGRALTDDDTGRLRRVLTHLGAGIQAALDELRR